MKTFCNKSNATRAAKKIEGSVVEQNDAGEWIVRLPVAIEGVDEPAQDDVPVVSVEHVDAPVGAVLLASEDGDYGLVRADDADQQAQDIANTDRVTITARNPITDQVIATYTPEPQPPVAAEPVVDGKFEEVEAPAIKRDGHGEFTAPVYMALSFQVLADDAVAEAIKLAKRMGVVVEVTSTRTGKLIHTADPATKLPAVAKAPKAAKPAKVAAPKAPPRDKSQPAGMAAKIIALCSRPEGATPAQLNELTNWSKAPWKWLLQNRKGTGFCDRFGYTLTDRDEGSKAAIYRMTKIAA